MSVKIGQYIEAPKSGKSTAIATATSIADLASLSETKTNGVVILQIDSTEAEGCTVIAEGYADGIVVPKDGSIVPFYIDDLDKIQLKRVGGTNVAVRWFAF